MSMTGGTEQVGLDFNVGGNFSATLSQMIAQADQYARASDTLIGQIGRLNMVSTTLIAKTNALTGANKIATAEAAAYQQRLSNIEATATLTGKSFDSLRRTTLELGRSYGDIGNAVRTVEALGSSGITAEKSIASLSRTWVQLGAANGVDAAAIGSELLQLTRTFGNSETAMGRYGDSLTKLSKNYGANAMGALSFANALAPVAASVGVSETAVIGLGTAAARLGQDGTYSANAFNKVLLDMSSALRNGGPAMKTYADMLGTTSAELGNLFRKDPTEALLRFTESIKTSGPQTQRYLEALGFDATRTVRALTSLSSQGNLRQIIAESTKAYGSGATETAAETALGGINKEMARMGETMSQTVAGAGQPFLQWLDKVLGAANAVSSAVAGIVQSAPVQAIGTAAAPISMAVSGLAQTAMFASTLAVGRRGLNFARGQGQEFGFGRELGGLGYSASGMPLMARMGAGVGAFLGPASSNRLPGAGGGLFNAVRTGAAGAVNLAAAGIDYQANDWRSARWRESPGMTQEDFIRRSAAGQRYRSESALNRAAAGGATGMWAPGSPQDAIAETRAAQGAVAAHARATVESTKAMAELTKETTGAAKPIGNLGRALAGGAASGGRYLGTEIASGTVMAGRGIGRGAKALGKAWGPLLAVAGLTELGMQLDQAGDRGEAGRAQIASGRTDVYGQFNEFAAAAGMGSKGAASMAETFGKSEQEIAKSVGSLTAAFSLSAEQITAIGQSNYKRAFEGVSSDPTALAAQARGILGQSPTSEAVARIMQDIGNQYGTGTAGSVGSILATQSPSSTLPQMLAGQFSQLGVLGQPTAASDTIGQSIVSYAGQASVQQSAVNGPAAGQASQFTSAQQLWEQALKGNQGQKSQAAKLISEILGIGDSDYVEYRLNTGESFAQFTSGAASASKPTPGFRGGGSRRSATFAPDTLLGNAFGGVTGVNDPSVGVGTDTNLGFAQTYQDLKAKGFNFDTSSPNYGTLAVTSGQEKALADLAPSLGGVADVFTSITKTGRDLNLTFDQLMNSEETRAKAARAGMTDEQRAVATAANSPTATNMANAAQTVASIAMRQNESSARAVDAIMKAADALGGSTTPQGRIALAAVGRVQGVAGIEAQTQGSSWAGQQAIAVGVNAVQGPVPETEEGQKVYAEQIAGATEALKADAAFRQQYIDANKTMHIAIARQNEQMRISEARANEDYYRSLEYAEEDYQISRMRATRDFNITMTRMSEDAAKSIYDPYQRIQAQTVWDAGSLSANLAEQNQAIAKQTAQVNRLKEQGLSQQAIDTLGLTESKNAQQVSRLLADAESNPAALAEINKLIAARLRGVTAATQNSNSVDYRRARADFRKSMSDTEKDYDKAIDRAGDAHELALARMHNDNTRAIHLMHQDLYRMGEQFVGDYNDVSQKFVDLINGIPAADKGKLSGAVKRMFDTAWTDVNAYLEFKYGSGSLEGYADWVASRTSDRDPRHGTGGVNGGGGSGGPTNVRAPSIPTTAVRATLPHTMGEAFGVAASESAHPSHNWHGLCDHFAANAYGLAHSGYADAKAHWADIPYGYKGGGTAPPGALVFWGNGKNGHVALSIGQGMVYTTDFVRDGKVDVARVSDITKQWGGYNGWSYPYFHGKTAPIAMQHGGIATRPMNIDVGEMGGHEAVIPLDERGMEFMAKAMGRYVDGTKVQQSRVQPYASSTSSVSYSYDQRTMINGPITVQAQDPNEMGRRLEAKNRFGRLVQPVGEALMPVQPFVQRSDRDDPDSLDLSVRISTRSGGWIELNDHVTFTVAEGSFTGEATTWRRKTSESDFLEGTYLVSAVRENVTRPLNVYIEGATHYDTALARQTLEDLVSQRSFQLVRTVENVSTLWACQTSDWTHESDRPLLHSRMVLMKIQVPCHPDETIVEEI